MLTGKIKVLGGFGVHQPSKKKTSSASLVHNILKRKLSQSMDLKLTYCFVGGLTREGGTGVQLAKLLSSSLE